MHAEQVSIHFTLSSLVHAGERHSLRYDNARGSGGRLEEHSASGASAGHEAGAAVTDAPNAWRALDAHVGAMGQPDADGRRHVVHDARAWLCAWRLPDGGPLPARQYDGSYAASAAFGSASAATAAAAATAVASPSPSRGADAEASRASPASRAFCRTSADVREAPECGRAADALAAAVRAAARRAAQAAQGGASVAAARGACLAGAGTHSCACAGSAAATASEARGACAAAQS